MDPAEIIQENFVSRLKAGDLSGYASALTLEEAGLTGPQLVQLFHSQILSRRLDQISRTLQKRGESFYTIASAGHEGNAAIAEAFRLEDMAFLHYRDAAFQIHRAKRLPGQTPTWDLLLGFAASAEDPIAGGRHKVIGSRALNIPPQTSTIASHLPKAMGAAFGVGLARRLALVDTPLADDSVVLCSFGDASANHSTAQGAINAALWAAHQKLPMPIVFVCEDNGIGISVRTPRGWIEAGFANRPGLRYFKCNGMDVLDTYRAATEAQAYARAQQAPVFLHMACARLYGHAGSDVEAAYISKAQIERTQTKDPLLHTAAILIDAGIMTADEVLRLHDEVARTVTRVAERAITRPKLETTEDVMRSLTPAPRAVPLANEPAPEERARLFGSDAAQMKKPQHMARLLNWALTDLMLEHRNIVLAGEDIGAKGGVYGVTQKLRQRFGPNRAIDTLLDEQSILGLAIGLAHNGMLAIPEIQFLAYIHNAEDQLRGEAATLSFFSNRQYANPMVVRIPGLGYQKGFGGHFHNDNSLAVFRDIPGVVMACPSNGRDAVGLLRECVRLALEEQRVVVFIEPIALYMTRDLHTEKDGLWTFPYDSPGTAQPTPLGTVHCHGEGEDLAIVSYGNGFYLSRQAEKILKDEHGLDIRVIDMRWLAPLPGDAILEAVSPCKQALIVDECRITGSQSEALMALFAERAPEIRTERLAAEDCFIPLGRAATLPLPSRDGIVAKAVGMTGAKDQ